MSHVLSIYTVDGDGLGLKAQESSDFGPKRSWVLMLQEDLNREKRESVYRDLGLMCPVSQARFIG